MSRAVAQTGAARWTLRLILLAGFVLLLRLNLPGHLSVDSVLALHEGRFGVRETWNPAIFGWLLGRADSVVPGAALAMGVSAAVLFGAWAALANLRRQTSWLAPLLALAVLALPQVIIYPGIVWKDVWFAEATVAGYVVLAFGLQARSAWLTWSLLILAAVFFAVAGLLRQNGLILALPAAVAIFWVGRRPGSAVQALLWLVGVAALAFALSIYAQPQGAGRPDSAGAKGVRLLQTYDLMGALARTPLPLTHIDRYDPKLDDRMRLVAPTLYSPQRVDTLSADATLSQKLAKAPDSAVQAEWFDLILRHPRLYLETRAEAFRWVLQTPVIDRCLPVHVGVQGPPRALADLKIPARQSQADGRLYNYVTWFLDTPAYSHLAFAGVALAVGLLLLFRRDPADLAIAGFMFGALAFAASFFVISIACDYRYLYLVDVAALTGLLYLAVDPRLTRR